MEGNYKVITVPVALKGGSNYYITLLNNRIAEILDGDYFTSDYFDTLLDAFEKSYGHLIEPSAKMKSYLHDVDTYKLSQFDGQSVHQYIFNKRATVYKAFEKLNG